MNFSNPRDIFVTVRGKYGMEAVAYPFDAPNGQTGKYKVGTVKLYLKDNVIESEDQFKEADRIMRLVLERAAILRESELTKGYLQRAFKDDKSII